MSETPLSLPSPAPSSSWKVRAGLFTVVLLGAMLLQGRTMFVMVPRFENLFFEMFGTSDKLPELTRFIIAASRFQQSFVLLLLPVLLLPFVLLWWSRGARWACIVCGVLAFLFTGLGLAAYPAVMIPTAQLIKDLTESGPPLTPEEREQIIKDLKSGKAPL